MTANGVLMRRGWRVMRMPHAVNATAALAVVFAGGLS
jgi:hypothetical protein